MNPELFEELVARWLEGTSTAEETRAMMDAIEQPGYARQLSHLMDTQLAQGEVNVNDFPETFRRIHDYVMTHKDKTVLQAGETPETLATEAPIRKMKRWRAVAAAAAIVIVAGAGWFLYSKQTKPETTLTAQTDIKAPVNNRATITLEGNGKQIVLADAKAGVILEQDGIKIIKLADGRIAYEGTSAQVLYNTASNPKNSQPMEVGLSDGTKIWLNAGSSVKYPMAFTGHERKIELQGEAYFDVTHNAKQPFRVKAGKDLIEDIGTAFNVNAYADEAGVTTTLVEGAIRIGNKQLKPNQQYLNGTISEADVPKALAWKNGKFDFGENASIKEVMRQLGRWYDVEVSYEGNVESLNDFGGKISRDISLKQALDGIASQRVHYEIEGRKVTIRQ